MSTNLAASPVPAKIAFNIRLKKSIVELALERGDAVTGAVLLETLEWLDPKPHIPASLWQQIERRLSPPSSSGARAQRQSFTRAPGLAKRLRVPALTGLRDNLRSRPGSSEPTLAILNFDKKPDN